MNDVEFVFPQKVPIYKNDGLGFSYHAGDEVHMGLTLRDYFAAKAMQGYISCGPAFESLSNVCDGDANKICSSLAKMSYQTADAMLKARESGK